MAFPTPPHLHHRSRSFPDSPLLIDILADEPKNTHNGNAQDGCSNTNTPRPPKKRQRLVRSITFQVEPLDGLSGHYGNRTADVLTRAGWPHRTPGTAAQQQSSSHPLQASSSTDQADYFSCRPRLNSRQPSYSKRSASSNSPREVPLPALPTTTTTQHRAPHSGAALMPSPVRISSPLVRRRPVSRQHITDDEKMELDDDHAFSDAVVPDDNLSSAPSPPPSAVSSDFSITSPFSSSSSSHHHHHHHHHLSHTLAPSSSSTAAAAASSTRSPITGRPHSEIIHAPTPIRPSSVASLPPPFQTPFQHLPRDPSSSSSHAAANNASLPRSSSPPMFDNEGLDDHLPPWLFTRGPSASAYQPISHSPPVSIARTTSPTPTPPTILTPPPPPSQPFLSHAPPPPDSWIVVDTAPSEYRLTVSLPGFSRDAITMSVRRRRVLHVVADRWEGAMGAGHFERRIAFGWDADLNLVRADFEVATGLLRVRVPRRRDQGGWWTSGLG